jgi:hypothetical protein
MGASARYILGPSAGSAIESVQSGEQNVLFRRKRQPSCAAWLLLYDFYMDACRPIARIYIRTSVESVPSRPAEDSMRENLGSSKLDRWASHGRGGECLERRAASPEDNSPERVFLECGLVIAVPLSIAALIELAMRMPAA